MPNYFTGSVTRNLNEKLGEVPSVLDFGAKADGIILLDGAITIADNTFTSASASFVVGDVGKTIWIEGAGAAGVDLLTTIASLNSSTSVEVTDAAGATVTGAEWRYGTDNTTAFQAAFDISTLANGAKIQIPRGVFLTTASVNLTHNLTLEGEGFSWHVWGYAKSVIVCCGNVPVLEYAGTTGDGWQSGTVKRLMLRGTARTGSKGIHTGKDSGTLLQDCGFYKFGDQAVHLDGFGSVPKLINVMVTDACLVRTRAAYVGCVDISGYDAFVDHCEVGASAESEAFGDGYVAGLVIRGTNSFVSNTMAEISQVGVYVPAVASLVTFVNVRADLNLGHGFVIDGSGNNFIGCRSHANSRATDSTYSAYLINGESNRFNGCQVTDNGPAQNHHAYGFHTTNANTTGANHFNGNYVMAGSCATKDYYFAGTQVNQCVHHQTNLLVTGARRTSVFEGDLLITDSDQLDGYIIQKFNRPDAGTGEKYWAIRPNYGVGYKQLFFSVYDDNFSNEDPYMKVDRTGAVVNSVTFPRQVILSVAPSVANYGQNINQSHADTVVHRFTISGADADEKHSEWRAQAGVGWSQFLGILWNDAGDAWDTWLRVSRTGVNVDQLELIADLLTLTGTVALGTPLAVTSGGTGAASLADHGVLLGSGTAAVTVTGAGTAGQPLTSNGASADPSFQDIAPAGFGSQIAKYFLAAPNASAGTPSFRAIVASDVPTLNQNTSGTAAGLSATLAIASGGTNATSEANARTNLDVYSKAEADALVKFTDRGDPAGWDISHTGLTIDSAWHDLDLSGYGVPDAATAVIIRMSGSNSNANVTALLRKNGNVNEVNAGALTTQVANINVSADVTIPLGSGAVIEYLVYNTGTWSLYLSVKGWIK